MTTPADTLSSAAPAESVGGAPAPRGGSKPPKGARARLGAQDILDLRIKTGCAEATVRHWAKGATVRPATNAKLYKAAAKLGIEVRDLTAAGKPREPRVD